MVITGTSADDILQGTEFDDSIDGMGGNDTLEGLAGADAFHYAFTLTPAASSTFSGWLADKGLAPLADGTTLGPSGIEHEPHAHLDQLFGRDPEIERALQMLNQLSLYALCRKCSDGCDASLED